MVNTLARPRTNKRDCRTESAIYVPPGWPSRVLPPAAHDWEATAVEFLLDCCPADYRAYPVLRRHPVVLARFAAEFVESQIRASKDTLGELRSSLHGHVPPDVVQTATEVCLEQGAALVRLRRSVALVEETLRGKIFLRQL